MDFSSKEGPATGLGPVRLSGDGDGMSTRTRTALSRRYPTFLGSSVQRTTRAPANKKQICFSVFSGAEHRLQEFPGLVDLLRECASQPIGFRDKIDIPRDYPNEIANRYSHFLVATSNGRAIGFLRLTRKSPDYDIQYEVTRRDRMDENSVYLGHLAIDKEFRKSGIGTILILQGLIFSIVHGARNFGASPFKEAQWIEHLSGLGFQRCYDFNGQWIQGVYSCLTFMAINLPGPGEDQKQFVLRIIDLLQSTAHNKLNRAGYKYNVNNCLDRALASALFQLVTFRRILNPKIFERGLREMWPV